MDTNRREIECACDEATSIGAHFDAKVRRGGPSGGLHKATQGLLELLGDPSGRSILELGSGRGGFLLKVLRDGAARATGVELSAASLDDAHSRLDEAGFGERAALIVGDAATLALAPHDWVVLDRVICCYPDADTLVANSSGAALKLYAFSVPDSRGWRGFAARLSRALDNGWNRFRGRPCTTFVHDLNGVERALRAAGFERRAQSHRGLWYLGVFERR
jgi:SAM-dependent methyltransferase